MPPGLFKAMVDDHCTEISESQMGTSLFTHTSLHKKFHISELSLGLNADMIISITNSF